MCQQVGTWLTTSRLQPSSHFEESIRARFAPFTDFPSSSPSPPYQTAHLQGDRNSCQRSTKPPVGDTQIRSSTPSCSDAIASAYPPPSQQGQDHQDQICHHAQRAQVQPRLYSSATRPSGSRNSTAATSKTRYASTGPLRNPHQRIYAREVKPHRTSGTSEYRVRSYSIRKTPIPDSSAFAPHSPAVSAPSLPSRRMRLASRPPAAHAAPPPPLC